jgi:hypothetical protein
MKPECTLKLKEVAKDVYYITARTQYELTSTFMRLQEFYESPYGEIRGNFFTHERYMDICAYGTKRSGKDIAFTYFQDWNGFNVPGEVFDEWVDIFNEHYLWDKEQALIDLIDEQNPDSWYYIIGTNLEGDHNDYDHELSHAMYYLNPEYTEEQTKNLGRLSERVRSQLKDYIMNYGYRIDVVDDEIIAYLSTNTMSETKDMMGGVTIPWRTILKFQEVFAEFKDSELDEDN